MKYFLDTEFYEDGTTIDLISIGIVSEDKREFYAVNKDARLGRVSDWVRENVLPHLPKGHDPAQMFHVDIGPAIRDFIREDKPEFWAYYADYDWVVLCQLFGTMMDLPANFPKFCRDLKQLSCDVGNPPHPAQVGGSHHALADARWNRDLYDFLIARKGRTISEEQIHRLSTQAYRDLGYQVVNFGADESPGVLGCPPKTIKLMNRFQELIFETLEKSNGRA